MDRTELRGRLRTLADDFAWLESHCRAHPDRQVHTTYLRLAGALTRNVVGPGAEGVAAKPLHIAVVGGAGAGKSTVVNFLVGAVVADANPQAGFTRHPSAFVPESLLAAWPATDGFLGPLRRIDGGQPADRDEDVYQRSPSPMPADDALAEFVIWDCPDMTTVAADGYTTRLTEVAALADVIVYVASDERYNDEIPTQYLHLLMRAGKAVVVCLTKVAEANAAGLTQHFRDEVLGKLPSQADGTKPNVPVACIPNIPLATRNDPGGAGRSHRIGLINPILAFCPAADVARQRTIANAARFLETAAEGLLDVARSDIREIDAWKGSVKAGREQFEERYRREFLAGETIRRFDRSRDELLALFDLPGKAQSISTVLGFVRWPFVKARDWLVGLVSRPPALALPERDVIAAGFTAWLDGLQAEAIRKSAVHPVWKQAAAELAGGAKQAARDRLTIAERTYETQEQLEIETEGKGLTDRFTQSPLLVNGLRGAKIAAEVAVVVLLTWWLWPPTWVWLLAVPFGLYAVHQTFEWGVRLIVETARAKIRGRRMALIGSQLSQPLEQSLAGLPVVEGTAIERINLVLGRVPGLIRDAVAAVRRPE
jgi:hypothetical protein